MTTIPKPAFYVLLDNQTNKVDTHIGNDLVLKLSEKVIYTEFTNGQGRFEEGYTPNTPDLARVTMDVPFDILKYRLGSVIFDLRTTLHPDNAVWKDNDMDCPSDTIETVDGDKWTLNYDAGIWEATTEEQ